MWKLLLPISWLEILKLRNFSDSEVLKLRMQSFVSSGNSLKHSAKSAWFVFELFRLNCSLPYSRIISDTSKRSFEYLKCRSYTDTKCLSKEALKLFLLNIIVFNVLESLLNWRLVGRRVRWVPDQMMGITGCAP